MILEVKPPPIDRQAILEVARQQACGSCTLRKTCRQRRSFSEHLLENPLEADCRKQDRLVPELRRARQQLRILQADRARQEEYRAALSQQYGFLSQYLRNLSDRLPRRGSYPRAEFRMEVSARSRCREEVNGDFCFAFPGSDCRYFVILCDGMGTGPGAAWEGRSGGNLLKKMLSAGFPAEQALQSLNSLLVLQGNGGAVSVDLAEIFLETGIVHIYKWGASPSWVLTRRGTEKIGTATPPPGISVQSVPMAVEKLSLRRGEVLLLVSDGVNGELLQEVTEVSPEEPLRDLAGKFLKQGSRAAEDDATVALIRLRPAGLPTS
jgi:serine phosphatase RsbU (regulator of sigma subunit)